MKRMCVLAMLALACAACVPPSHTIEVRPGTGNAVSHAPAYVGEGDEVRVVVHDAVWANRYVGASSATELAAISTSAVEGTTDLSKITSWLSFLRPAAQASGAGSPPAGGASPNKNFDHLLGVNPFPTPSPPPPPAPPANTVASATERLLHTRNRVGEVALRHADAFAVLSFLTNDQAKGYVALLADDRTPGELSTRLLQASQGERLNPAELEGLVQRGRAYADRLAALGGILEPVQEPDRATGAELNRTLDSLSAAAANLRKLGVTPDVHVLGLNLAPFLDRGEAGKWTAGVDTLAFRLSTIERDAQRLAATLNVLPRLTTGPDTATALVQQFAGGNRVTVTVVRNPRFGTFSLNTTQQPAGGGGKGDDDDDDDDGDGKKGAAHAAGTISEKGSDTVASVSFDVYKRYRLHLTTGLVFSPLHTHTFETPADTVDGVAGVRLRETEVANQSVFPAALLSYTLFPFAGKMSDARVWRRPSLENFGLAVQGGVSLVHPDQDLFVGLSTEPFPGVNVGVGRHYGHVERTTYASGTFVPDSAGPATSRRWRHRTAVNVSFDPSVLAGTLLSLFK